MTLWNLWYLLLFFLVEGESLVCLGCRTVLQYFSSLLEMWHSLFLLLAQRDLISETMVSGQTCQRATLVFTL